MYTIYEIPGVKIGCTTNLTKRQRDQKYLGELDVLEYHTDIYKASERERELQAEKGYRVDNNPYWYVVQVQSLLARTPKARKKMKASFNHDILRNSKAVKAYKVTKLPLRERRKTGEVFKTKEFIGVYTSGTEAERALGLQPKDVSKCILRKDLIQMKGYWFEFVQ